LAPINPLITYRLYKDWKNKNIHLEKFPTTEKIKEVDIDSESIMELNSQIWNYKKSNNKPLNAEIKKAIIPVKFRIIEKDIINTHKIQKLEFGKEIKLEL